MFFGIRDGKKSGSGINIPDPQNWLRYVFAILRIALYLWRIVIPSNSYRFRLFADIASDGYHSDLAGQRYRFTSLLL